MIPPAAGAVGSPGVPAGWPDSADGAGNDEPGPDDITTPMAAIKPGAQSSAGGRDGDAVAPAAPSADSSAAAPAADNGGRSGAGNGEPRVRGPFEPGNDLPAPVDESMAKPFYRGKLPPAPDAPADELTPVAPAAAGNQPADPPPASRSGSAARGNGKPMSQAARASIWSPSAAKMDRIKDLYITAEAIGEDALDKHFELVSERQRQLIREYFDGAVGGEQAAARRPRRFHPSTRRRPSPRHPTRRSRSTRRRR